MAKGVKTGGRKKGQPNKLTRDAKAAIETAYQKIGGDATFAAWAKDNQTEFYTRCFTRILPKELEHSGPDGEPIRVVVLPSLQ